MGKYQAKNFCLEKKHTFLNTILNNLNTILFKMKVIMFCHFMSLVA